MAKKGEDQAGIAAGVNGSPPLWRGLGVILLTNAIFAIVGIMLLGGALWGRFFAPGPLVEDRVVLLERGADVGRITHTLAESGVIADPSLFALAVRFTTGGQTLKAGEYVFDAGMSAAAVLDRIIRGETLVRRLTIAEGLTSWEILQQLAAADGLSGAVTLEPAEGSLLPETYYYNRGDRRDDKIRRMQAAMAQTVQRLWPQRRPDLPFDTPEEAIILASIVEKETALPAERPRVAAVFVNRLNRGMRLQSDPTVIYAATRGRGGLGRRIRRSELDSDDPYNTYAHAGLPPGPIANPGAASIAAVLNPPNTEDLYFVADGSGGHAFAATLEEHNRNVARWRAIQRERGLR